MLRFQKMRNNRKTAPLIAKIRAAGYHGQVLVFGLPSGPFWSCRFAQDCAASAVPHNAAGRPLPAARWREAAGWKVANGPKQQFRCYAASEEVIFRQLRELLIRNREALDLAYREHPEHGMSLLIGESLGEAGAWNNGSVVRVHANGDFFSIEYLQAWLDVARLTPENRYYWYSKAVSWHLLVGGLGGIPANVSVTFSRGGTEDHLIDRHRLKEAVVVASAEEAAMLGLEVDHDDSHALFGTERFALIVHGAGTAHVRKRGHLAHAAMPLAAD